MSEANKQLLGRFVREWLNAHGVEAFRSMCTDDYAAHWGVLGTGYGCNEVARMEQYVLDAFPDLVAETEWMVAEGDLVVRCNAPG